MWIAACAFLALSSGLVQPTAKVTREDLVRLIPAGLSVRPLAAGERNGYAVLSQALAGWRAPSESATVEEVEASLAKPIQAAKEALAVPEWRNPRDAFELESDWIKSSALVKALSKSLARLASLQASGDLAKATDTARLAYALGHRLTSMPNTTVGYLVGTVCEQAGLDAVVEVGRHTKSEEFAGLIGLVRHPDLRGEARRVAAGDLDQFVDQMLYVQGEFEQPFGRETLEGKVFLGHTDLFDPVATIALAIQHYAQLAEGKPGIAGELFSGGEWPSWLFGIGDGSDEDAPNEAEIQRAREALRRVRNPLGQWQVSMLHLPHQELMFTKLATRRNVATLALHLFRYQRQHQRLPNSLEALGLPAERILNVTTGEPLHYDPVGQKLGEAKGEKRPISLELR